MYCREFFKTLREATAWAESMGDKVCGVFSIDKPGTKMRFCQEKADAEFYGRDHSGSRAVVIYIR